MIVTWKRGSMGTVLFDPIKEEIYRVPRKASIIWKQLGTNTLFLPERMVVARNIADTVLNFIF